MQGQRLVEDLEKTTSESFSQLIAANVQTRWPTVPGSRTATIEQGRRRVPAVGVPRSRWLLRARLRTALWFSPEDANVRASDVDRQHIFVGLAADYGNLGDLAITNAQVSFLQEAFPDATVEPIPISRSLSAIKRLRHAMAADDVITLLGGGNTGDMYDDIQYLRELFVANFRQHQVLSFPQTIEFSATHYGQWAARRAARIYNSHPALTVMARDSASLDSAKALFPKCVVTLAPDVVLTLDRSAPPKPRQGIIVALRDDLERTLSQHEQKMLIDAASAFGDVRRRDTHVGSGRFNEHEALAHLESAWGDWQSSRLVVTDRLHGMIFAVITGTPCLAVDSATGKVSRFYEDWLTDIPSVKLLAELDPTTTAEMVGTLHAMSAAEQPVDAYRAEFVAKLRDAALL